MVLGIPGHESMALLMVAFVGAGLVPGPQMLADHLDIVFTQVWIIVFANVLVSLIGLAVSPFLARLPSLNPKLIIPLVLSVCLVGAFATHAKTVDVVIAMLFGAIGYMMDRFHYSRANFVIGMVLALMIERNLHVSLTLYGDWFLLTHPIALAMLIFIVVTTAMPFVRAWLARRAAALPGVTEGSA
jgi:TctA family transporter